MIPQGTLVVGSNSMSNKDLLATLYPKKTHTKSTEVSLVHGWKTQEYVKLSIANHVWVALPMMHVRPSGQKYPAGHCETVLLGPWYSPPRQIPKSMSWSLDGNKKCSKYRVQQMQASLRQFCSIHAAQGLARQISDSRHSSSNALVQPKVTLVVRPSVRRIYHFTG